jgi:hypothetical protein
MQGKWTLKQKRGKVHATAVYCLLSKVRHQLRNDRLGHDPDGRFGPKADRRLLRINRKKQTPHYPASHDLANKTYGLDCEQRRFLHD